MFLFPERAKISSPLENFKIGYVIYPASYSKDTESIPAGINLVSQSTSAESMNDWSYTSTLPPPHMPLWRAQGPFTYTCRPITVDYVVGY